MLVEDDSEELEIGNGGRDLVNNKGRSEERQPLRDKLASRARQAWERIDQQLGDPSLPASKCRYILIGWVILGAFLIIHIGIFSHYILVCVAWPRTHGWKALTAVMGLDVDDETTDCETRTWSNVNNNEMSKVYIRCSPKIYFGPRSFGNFLYFGLYALFFLHSSWFLRSTSARYSLKFQKLLDNVTFFIGLFTFLDILIVLGIFHNEVNGIESRMRKDNMNLPDPFISRYWETAQIKGECCGVWGGAYQWRTSEDGQSQSIPISCCNTKVYSCSEEFSKPNEVWEVGCLEFEYNYVLRSGWLHIFGLVLQLGLLITFDHIQRKIQSGARESFLPEWVPKMFSRQEVVVPVKSTRLYSLKPTQDWPMTSANANANPNPAGQILRTDGNSILVQGTTMGDVQRPPRTN